MEEDDEENEESFEDSEEKTEENKKAIRLDVGVDWSFGLTLIKLVRIDRKIGYFKLKENLGYKNLEKFPFRFEIVTKLTVEPTWKDIKNFEFWLQESFGNGKYVDGVYFLWGKKSGLKYVLKFHYGHKKRYQPVRPWASLCKFYIRNGEVEFSPKDNRRKKVMLMFKGQKTKMMERPKRIMFKR